MPRGKRTVFGMYCTGCKARYGSIRLHRQNSKGVGWKDYKREKYCADCRKRTPAKLKEEKHSS
jgi:hypothetical protein